MKRLLDFIKQRRAASKRASEEAARAAESVTTFTGSNIPGHRIQVLGVVSFRKKLDPDYTRQQVKVLANKLGANYIINYREEESRDLVDTILCSGDAVRAVPHNEAEQDVDPNA